MGRSRGNEINESGWPGPGEQDLAGLAPSGLCEWLPPTVRVGRGNDGGELNNNGHPFMHG
jgi:hypothetical protein